MGHPAGERAAKQTLGQGREGEEKERNLRKEGRKETTKVVRKEGWKSLSPMLSKERQNAHLGMLDHNLAVPARFVF